MGFYAKHVLPHVIDLVMRNKDAARLRAGLVPQASGDVLEVGIGPGLNLPFYSGNVNGVYGVDPSIELQRMDRERATVQSVNVEFLCQKAEEALSLKDESIDTIVMTWTLCSVADPAKVLNQMRRVLKPNGRLLFVEHGWSPNHRVAAWQDRLTSIWKNIGGGCHLNRKAAELIQSAGFQIIEVKNFYLPGPHPMTYTYEGAAI